MTADPDLVLGIDCSTTAAKAVAWDRAGSPVAEGRAPLDLLSPHPGWGEQRADDWWHATRSAIADLLTRMPPSRIAALCVTHQRETFVPVDAAGRPLRQAILWLDERSRPQLDALDDRLGHDHLHRLTGRPPSLTQSLPKLLWLAEESPHVAAAASRIVDVGAFLIHRLTGEWRTSLASADPMGIVDMPRAEWAADVIRAIGLRPDQFCPLVPPGTIVGGLSPAAAAATGLPPATPVVAGAGDGQAASLGAGVTAPGRAFVNLGTAIAGGTVADRYLTDRAFRTCCGAIPGTFVLESVLRGGTATLSWFIDHWADPRLDVDPHRPSHGDDPHPASPTPSHATRDPFAAYESAAAALPPGAAGLLLVPYWNTVMNPYWDPAATGVTLGWTTAHRRHHLYRAILEGIAFEHRLAVDGIAAASAVPLTEHVVLGGGSRSPLWCQILADVLGAPLLRARSADATNLGAAVLAAAALGWYPTIAAAAAAMTATTDRFAPHPPHQAAYDRLFRDIYRPIFPALRPILDRLTALTSEHPAAPPEPTNPPPTHPSTSLQNR